MERKLIERSGGVCELSKLTENLVVYTVYPGDSGDSNKNVYISEKCVNQLNKKEELDTKFWTFLKESMWSEVPAVQVLSWRMLNRLRNESWAMEALEMMYMDDDTLEWAKSGVEADEEVDTLEVHKDCNGVQLNNGDNVVLIKSLDVKGSSVNAKMGTPVRNIKLVADNTDQIEGKIEGQQIVILTKYVRKS